MTEINIWVLGEKRVGKSTLIKAIINYMTYNSLQEAILKNCTPVLGNVVPNISHLKNKCYFVTNGITICLIDTSGIEKIHYNMWNRKIIEHNACNLPDKKDIHGILIVLQPNMAYIQDFITMCIKEITLHLGNNACSNIAFIFTKSNICGFQVKNMILKLKKCILEIGLANIISIGEDSVFCVDNEHELFLSNFKFKDYSFKTCLQKFTSNWQKSSTEVQRLIGLILTRASARLKRRPESLTETAVYSKELNILILGETGVGKSTWINGLANYLKFNTLMEAIEGNPSYLIPAAFTIYEDVGNKVINVGSNSDNTEDCTIGISGTQRPKSYTFTNEDTKVCLIDTPGIGDTRGKKQDEINFAYTMYHLSNLKELHGICILLKSGESRLTESYNYYLLELFRHLHKDVCKNIVFIFTHAQIDYFEGGDTLLVLKKWLKINSLELDIALSKEKLYFLDNQTVRYIALKQAGIEFASYVHAANNESWKQSSDESRRLLTYIAGLKPHSIINTVSVNMVRRLISYLEKPIVQINENMQENLIVLEKKTGELQKLKDYCLNRSRMTKLIKSNLKLQQISFTSIICTNPKCILNETCALCLRSWKCNDSVTQVKEVTNFENGGNISIIENQICSIKQFILKTEQSIFDLENVLINLIIAGENGKRFLDNNSTVIENDLKEYCLNKILTQQWKLVRHVEKRKIQASEEILTPSKMYEDILALCEMPLTGSTIRNILAPGAIS